MKNGTILCPSSLCIEGSAIIGTANKKGTVDILEKPVPVTPQFLETESAKDTGPETRFRFANTCVKNACNQWNGKGCGIIEMVTGLIKIEEQIKKLPECGIRSQCRWYLQKGVQACSVCKFVITDNRTTR